MWNWSVGAGVPIVIAQLQLDVPISPTIGTVVVPKKNNSSHLL
jgi:hypothetical protein